MGARKKFITQASLKKKLYHSLITVKLFYAGPLKRILLQYYSTLPISGYNNFSIFPTYLHACWSFKSGLNIYA